VFPSETKDEDTYAYNDAGEMSEVKMLKGTETLASLVYARDKDGHVKAVTSKGLPGEEKPSYEYDSNNRLTKGAGTSYEYDSANNLTKIGAGTYKYNSGDELETGPSLTYTYNEEGQRTKTTPSSGPATTYGYDQAGNLTAIERPKEGETSEIKDSYAYNGDGLRVSQAISGTTTYMAWDTAEELPLLLSDGTNSYIYGPGGLPVEQINISTGTTTYLHHDQQGSTRLLTGSAGTVTGKCTYTPYGTPTCEGGTTTPLGFDGQYTSSDTGLIYLRARVYDPATGQFLSVDPRAEVTGSIYTYARDNPLSNADPSGENAEGSQVAHELLALERQGLNELHAKHRSEQTIELFQRIVKVQLYYGLAFAEENGPDERLGAEELNKIEWKLSSEILNQLQGLETDESAKSVLTTLVKVGWLLYHIYGAEVRARPR